MNSTASGDAVRTWELSLDSGIDSIFLTPLYFVGAEDDPFFQVVDASYTVVVKIEMNVQSCVEKQPTYQAKW